jgi:hypothetical protein
VGSTATTGATSSTTGVGAATAARAATTRAAATAGNMSSATGVEMATTVRTAAMRAAAMRAAAMRAAAVRAFMLSECGAWEAGERERYSRCKQETYGREFHHFISSTQRARSGEIAIADHPKQKNHKSSPRVYGTHVGRLKFQCPIVVWRWSKPLAEESMRPRTEKKADRVSQNQQIAGSLQGPPDTGVLYLQFLLYTHAAPRPHPSSESTRVN